jgi:Ser/Thr protein kinase RdoA (MazF antagonist)
MRRSPNLADAAHHFFTEPYTLRVLHGAAGLSGSALAHVITRDAHWCLRHWPAAVQRSRLAFIHRVLTTCERQDVPGIPRLATMPEGQTILELDGALFDAQTWVPGSAAGRVTKATGPQPNLAAPLPPARLVAVARALARFHSATKTMRPESSDEYAPLSKQLADFVRQDVLRVGRLSVSVQQLPAGADRAWALHWIALVLRTAYRLTQVHSIDAGTLEATPVVGHGDLWPGHTFFHGTTFTGFIDFERCAFTSPTIDIAQLIVHFNGWESCEMVIDAYTGIRPLSAAERNLIPIAAALDLAGEAVWSLAMLYDDDHHTMHRGAGAMHHRNLNLLHSSFIQVLESLTRI